MATEAGPCGDNRVPPPEEAPEVSRKVVWADGLGSLEIIWAVRWTQTRSSRSRDASRSIEKASRGSVQGGIPVGVLEAETRRRLRKKVSSARSSGDNLAPAE